MKRTVLIFLSQPSRPWLAIAIAIVLCVFATHIDSGFLTIILAYMAGDIYQNERKESALKYVVKKYTEERKSEYENLTEEDVRNLAEDIIERDYKFTFFLFWLGMYVSVLVLSNILCFFIFQ